VIVSQCGSGGVSVLSHHICVTFHFSSPPSHRPLTLHSSTTHICRITHKHTLFMSIGIAQQVFTRGYAWMFVKSECDSYMCELWV